MTDRELLELAAKAAGMPWDRWVEDGDDSWNSLEDDGDAFRLSVILQMDTVYSPEMSSACAWCSAISDFVHVPIGNDAAKAMRRAITVSAANEQKSKEAN